MSSKLSSIFFVNYGTQLDRNKMIVSDTSDIAFVSRSSKNNGITAYVDEINDLPPLPAGSITVTLGGTFLLSSFLQEKPFYTGQNVAVLTPKISLSREQKLFYCLCISKNRYLYSAFGREANRTLKDLLVPDIKMLPSWINEVDLSIYENADLALIPQSTDDLISSIYKWKTFTLDELFDIKKGKRLTRANMSEGKTPFVGSTDSNNGLTNTVGQLAIHDGNVISVNYNGSVGESFYQPIPFWASDDVNVLYPRELYFPIFNQYIALFIIPLIKKNKFKFNYGRKWHLDRMKETKIVLPVKNGSIDLDMMEQYIKSMPYSCSI